MTDREPASKRPSTLERAFELARSGSCHTLDDIRFHLKHDSYDLVDGHLAGVAIRQQLKDLMRAARETKST